MEIKREYYLNKLIKRQNNGLVKVITGIRRCGKSYLLNTLFYNYLLKCFVIIDLKTTKLSHSDIGQMDMYVRMFDELKRGTDDNPTIGIIMCTDKSETMVKYSVLQESQQIFASKYKTVLPTEEELADMISKENTKLLTSED